MSLHGSLQATGGGFLFYFSLSLSLIFLFFFPAYEVPSSLPPCFPQTGLAFLWFCAHQIVDLAVTCL